MLAGMSSGRTRYERAFEAHLIRRGIPYVSVDQASAALLPRGTRLDAQERLPDGRERPATLKSFDFVIYGSEAHALIEVKGRAAAGARPRVENGGDGRGEGSGTLPPVGRLESWVTLDDVESMVNWKALFGPPFQAYFVFLFRLAPEADARLFREWFEHDGVRYAVLSIDLDNYRASMKTRSPRWRTVDIPTVEFLALAEPLSLGARAPASLRRGPAADPRTRVDPEGVVVSRPVRGGVALPARPVEVACR